MKRFLKIAGGLLLLLIVLVLIAGIFLPKSFHFEQSISIQAPKEVVWQNVSLYANVMQWDPWIEKDPGMNASISGTDGAVGATRSWDGNADVGSGNQTITAINPMERVDSKIQFLKPFESQATTYYALSDTTNGGIRVLWAIDFEMPYPFNAMSVFMDPESNLENDFSKGLEKLKTKCEKEASDPSG